VPYIQNEEIRSILSAFSRVKSDYSPKMAFFLINKKINNRFF